MSIRHPQTDFEKQVIQIASLGVWQIVTGHMLKKPLKQVSDPRWEEKSGLFVTLRKNNEVRGSMGLLESTTTLAETLFDCGQTAATHDNRFPPIEHDEMQDLEIEVTLLSEIQKIDADKLLNHIKIGETGLIITRGEKRGVLLPHVAIEQKLNAESFLEACREKAQLSHKAWKDPNTLIECFTSVTLDGQKLLANIESFI